MSITVNGAIKLSVEEANQSLPQCFRLGILGDTSDFLPQ